MDLFENDPTANLLPCDGVVHYHGPIFRPKAADDYFQTLLHSVAWKNDVVVLFGKTITTARKVAWYGDRGCHYAYSGSTKLATPWIPTLSDLKEQVESRLDTSFNSCLLNLYHDGSEGMSWHSDDESDLVPDAPIASLSFGAERKFSFKHKRQPDVISLVLDHGGLLVMGGATQKNWLHSLPKTKRITTPRINLTFRKTRSSAC